MGTQETHLSFDKETYSLLERLHEAWATHAPGEAYCIIRDSILGQREQLDTRIATLCSVAKIACANDLNTDSRWDEIFTLANQIKAHTKADCRKRKRAYNESNRLRNLALVAALWSPDLVFYYDWNTVSQIQMNMLRACATRYPRFNDDFRPRLNRVLLDRHKLGIKYRRGKTLNEAPLQPHRDFDLVTLASAVPNDDDETQWIINEDGHVAVDVAGTLLKDLRPDHFRMYLLRRDRYGLLISRDETPPSPRRAALSPTITTIDPFAGPTGTVEPHYQVQCTTQSESVAHSSTCVSTGLFSLPSLIPTPEYRSPILTAEIHSSDYGVAVSRTASMSGSPVAASLHDMPETAPSSVVSNYELHGQTFDQFTLDYSFDFDLDTLTNLPACSVPSSRGNRLRTDADQGHVRQMSASINLACGSSDPATELLRSASPGSLLRDPERPELLLISPLTDLGDSLTVEGGLHNRYRDMITSYLQEIATQNTRADVKEQQKLRAQWLSPTTRWASVWTQPESELPCGRARSSSDADVLYFTSDELMTTLQKGYIFRKPIVIKERFSDSGMHTFHNLAFLLQIALINPVRDFRRIEHDQSKQIDIDMLLKDIRTDCYDGHNSTFNLQNITRSHRPLLTMLPRFRLLDNLVERARGGDPNNHDISTAGEINSCVSFNTLSFTGAYSGAHLTAMGGSWIRNLNGVKIWTMVPEENMGPEWETFAKAGTNWTPTGSQKVLILEQDDVLLIPPGIRVVHAMHSPTKGLIEGGILWDCLNVVQMLNSMYWVFKHQITQDEPIAYQLPRLIAELEVLVKHQPGQFRGDRSESDFLLAFEQAVSQFRDLGCNCSCVECEEWCSCRGEERQCTTWCAAHLDIANRGCI